MNTAANLSLRLDAIRFIARDILAFEFVAPDGGKLPTAQAGAHIGLILPNGVTRQYSLVHAGSDLTQYEVAVKRDANSGGGSVYMHDQLRVGTVLRVEPARNNFPLAEDAPSSVFFAGGIGITPIHAMLERLHGLARPSTLYYASRHREDMAYLPQLSSLTSLQVHVDAENQGRVLDLTAIIATLPRDAHLYCCGPAPMLAAFEAVTANWPPQQIHVEYFTAREAAATEGGFTVALARSGRVFQIPPGTSILNVLRDAGLTLTSSCEQGVCAACETRVLEGVPDHRDAILSPAERSSNSMMMICCSGSKTPRLVLDL
jgi:ferredoxin-NADP reductase